MRIEDFHLTYCTNVHPAQNWAETFASLVKYCLPLKENLVPSADFAIGLRLSDQAANELLQDGRLQEFREWLEQNRLYVFTLNGFPYGGFHKKPVRENVYAPDWQTLERKAYTSKLARILAELLPGNMDGSISTLPLSYRPWLSQHVEAYDAVCANCCRNLAMLVLELVRIREESGKLIHVDIEPEPDCLLECSSDVILFYNEWLLGAGRQLIASELRCSLGQAESLLRDHVRVCYDACHFALAWETPAVTMQRLKAEGIAIGKVQLSSALKASIPADPAKRMDIAQTLHEFTDGIWLHQVSVRSADGTCRNYPDLEQALPRLAFPGAQEWRIHFHVPLFIRNYDILSSTQEELLQTLRFLQQYPVCRQLEIETYTWSALPAPLKTGLKKSIEREYRWVVAQLCDSSPPYTHPPLCGIVSHRSEAPCNEPSY